MVRLSDSTHIVQTAQSLSSFTCQYTVNITEVSGSTDVSANTTKVKVEYSAKITSNILFTGTSRPKAGYLKVTVNGTTKTFTLPFNNGSNAGTVLASGSYNQTITHNNDGTKTINVSAKIEQGEDPQNYNVVWQTTSTASDTLTLTNIPRQSTATVSPSNLPLSYDSNTLTVFTNRKVNSYTHTLVLTLGTYTSTQTGVESSTIFSIPHSIVSQMTSKTMNGTITMTTYNGSSQVGTTTTTTFTVSIDPTVDAPVIGDVTLTDINPSTAAVESENTFISGAATLQAVIAISHIGDSTPARAAVTCGTTTQFITISGSSVTYTKEGVDSNTLTITVTDTRGVSVTKTVLFTLIPYQPVKIYTGGALYRSNNSGVPTDAGEHATFDGKVAWYSGTFGSVSNTLTVTYKYREVGTTEYTTGSVATAFPPGTGNQVVEQVVQITTGEEFNLLKEYDVVFIAEDAFSSYETDIIRLHEGFPVYGWGRNHFDVYGALHTHNRADPTEYLEYGISETSVRTSVPVFTHGFITAGGTKAVLFIPLINLPTKPVITQLSCIVRTVDGGYLVSNGADLASEISVVDGEKDVKVLKEQSALRIVLERPTATYPNGFGVTNNTPLCGEITLSYTYEGADS